MKYMLGLALLLGTPLALASGIAGSGKLDCAVSSERGESRWQVELDDGLPLAAVDDHDRPADYNPSHVRIRLAIDGPVLTIGRVSGRIVATGSDGATLGAGLCTPQAQPKSRTDLVV